MGTSERQDASVIDEFIALYSREVDFYSAAASIVRSELEDALMARGIRAIVTARAKRPDSLHKKLVGRDRVYRTTEDVRQDIVDLAGARIALYFPGQRVLVSKLIAELFRVERTIEFPTANGNRQTRNRLFPGYVATHHRVFLREDLLSSERRRYSSARVEIQVASVLMHAWAEVEHDLAYKPLSGDLSLDERRILDELNGLVLSGELSLEGLQRAFEKRANEGERRFRDQYDLAAVISEFEDANAKNIAVSPSLGRTDHLLEVARALGVDTPSRLTPILRAVSAKPEAGPIAQRVLQGLIGDDEGLIRLYAQIRDGGAGRGDKTADKRSRFLDTFGSLEARAAELPNNETIREGLARYRPLRDLTVQAPVSVGGTVLDEATTDIERMLGLSVMKGTG